MNLPCIPFFPEKGVQFRAGIHLASCESHFLSTTRNSGICEQHRSIVCLFGLWAGVCSLIHNSAPSYYIGLFI